MMSSCETGLYTAGDPPQSVSIGQLFFAKEGKYTHRYQFDLCLADESDRKRQRIESRSREAFVYRCVDDRFPITLMDRAASIDALASNLRNTTLSVSSF
jgi:hypothetical protein